MGALAHVLGLDDASGGWYLLWSGIFGDASILAVPVILWRKHTCHTPGCARLGTFPDGTWYRCRKHHPLDNPGSQA